MSEVWYEEYRERNGVYKCGGRENCTFSGKGQDGLVGLIGSEQEGSMAECNVCKRCRGRLTVCGR